MIFNNNFRGRLKRNRAGKADRPMVRTEMTPIDWLLEACAIVGLMIFMGYIIYYFPRLPETIPSHFDGAGKPDDYAEKATMWFLPAIAMFIYILFSVIVLIPHQFNYTVKITPANAPKQYAMALRLIRYLKAALTWMFFYISYATIQVSLNKGSGLGIGFIPVVFGGILIPLFIYMIVAYRNR